uniref:Nucleoprotein n=1 Tax=Blattodean phenui-related virus OKIAV261 TaxID=2746240 RepID=A0A7D7IVQ1_9VIRU|nr:nucleocapsid protein [Blattodean phenui-related virus OKIAV261]
MATERMCGLMPKECHRDLFFILEKYCDIAAGAYSTDHDSGATPIIAAGVPMLAPSGNEAILSTGPFYISQHWLPYTETTLTFLPKADIKSFQRDVLKLSMSLLAKRALFFKHIIRKPCSSIAPSNMGEAKLLMTIFTGAGGRYSFSEMTYTLLKSITNSAEVERYSKMKPTGKELVYAYGIRQAFLKPRLPTWPALELDNKYGCFVRETESGERVVLVVQNSDHREPGRVKEIEVEGMAEVPGPGTHSPEIAQTHTLVNLANVLNFRLANANALFNPIFEYRSFQEMKDAHDQNLASLSNVRTTPEPIAGPSSAPDSPPSSVPDDNDVDAVENPDNLDGEEDILEKRLENNQYLVNAYKDIKRKVKELGGNNSLINIFGSGTIGSVEAELLAAVMEVVAYQGFDPMKTMESMLALAGKAAGIPEFTFSIKGKDVKYTDVPEGRHQAVKRVKNDAFFLLVLFVVRGTNFRKQEQRMNEDAANLFGRLLDRYGISKTPRVTTRPLDSKTITLPRIAAALATETLRLANKGLSKIIIPLDAIKPPADAPACLFSNLLPSVVPQDKETFPWSSDLLNLSKWCSMCFDNRIKSDGKKPLTSFEVMDQYILASHMNAIYSDTARVNFLAGVGVLDRDLKLKPELLELCTRANELYTNARRAEEPSRGVRAGQQGGAGFAEQMNALLQEIRDMRAAPAQ